MDTYQILSLVSNWGIRLTDASKSQARMCSDSAATEECREMAYISMGGNYRMMAKNVVGFAKDAPRSSATNAGLAVVCKCPGCGDLFWYHINREAVGTFVESCPLWPEEQKNKIKQ